MLAILLYLAATLALIAVWRRFVTPISNAAAIALLLLPFCFTGRALLSGRVYAPIDLPLLSEPLKDYGPDYGVESAHHAGLSDLYMQIIPWQSAVRQALAKGEWPVWNPYLLCGSILAANMQAAPYDAVQLLGLLLPHAQALTFGAAFTFFLAALFTFAFVRALGCSEIAALIAAAIYTFCAFLATFVGWPLGRVWVFLPLVLLGVRSVVRETNLRAAVLLTAGLVLTIFAGHPESILHIVFVGVVYGVYELLGGGRLARFRRASRPAAMLDEAPDETSAASGRDARPPWRAMGLAAICGVLALLLTAISLLPFFSVAPYTYEYRVRREHFATAKFEIPAELIAGRAASSLFPFAGGRPEGGRMATRWDASAMRVGSVALALALAALLLARKRRDTWFFFAFAVVMVLAGLNAPPVGAMLHALPLFDIALNERLGFAAVFALSVLAAFAVDAWPMERRRALATAAIAVLLGIGLAIGAAALRDAEIRAGTDPSLIVIGTLAELIPLAILAALLVLRVQPRFALPAVLALILVQRVVEDGGIYPVLPEKMFYPEIPILRHMQNDPATPFRIVGLWYALVPDTSAVYGLEDARGYEAMTFHRLHETYPLWSEAQPVSFNIIKEKARPFLSFLNVKYAIGSLDAQPDADWKLVMQDRQSRLLENTRVAPRAFIPRRIRYRPTDGEVTLGMKLAKDFVDAAWILVPHYPAHEIANGPGTLTIRRKGSGYDIDAVMDGDGWVVISDSKWPGWRAYVDGKRVETHYANHAFIGVYVPKGKHYLRVVFVPEAFTRGRNVTLTTIAGLIVFLGVRRHRRRFQSGGFATALPSHAP